MRRLFENISIRNQLLLILIPLIIIVISINSYLSYKSTIKQHKHRELDKIENITNGCELFILNHDLSLQLIENDLDVRFDSLFHQLLNLPVYLPNANLDSIQRIINMDTLYEDIYIINKQGIIINTTNEKDLGLNMFDFGPTYKKFLEDVWLTNDLVIERVANESSSNTPKKFAYQAINEDYILEVGIKSNEIDSVINDFDLRIKELKSQYDNLLTIDLFGATEKLPAKNKNPYIIDSLKSVIISVYEHKSDTAFSVLYHDTTYYFNYRFLEMRNSKYFKGYVLQIISDDSTEKKLIQNETKRFYLLLIISLSIIVVLIILITWYITKPLHILTDELEQMMNLKMLKEVHINNSKETSLFSYKFNQLIKVINNLQNTLQQKIENKTKDLNQKNKKLEKLLQEKETLLKEIHHRVKNSLQIVSSLLSLQSKMVNDEKAKAAFSESISRIQAIGLLHEKLYQNSDYINVKADKYLSDLVKIYEKTIDKNIIFKVNVAQVFLNASQAISLGLIINEFITNSVKHAFNDKQQGVIEINLIHKDDRAILKLKNNGKPLPNDFNPNETNNSLGMIIIEAFTEKLEGTFKFYNIEQGVELLVKFPIINTFKEEE